MNVGEKVLMVGTHWELSGNTVGTWWEWNWYMYFCKIDKQ
jgi:hypothetical protein